MLQRKGQVGVFGFIILMALFLVMFVIALAPIVSQAGTMAVGNGMTGIEAFLFENLNMLIIIIALLATAAYLTFGGGQ